MCAVACVLALGPAHAELWAFVDEQGVSHFAATQLDERYQLFHRGADLTALPSPAPARIDPQHPPAAAQPRRVARIDASQGYRAVQKHLRAAARAHRIDYELLKAVIAVESGFDPRAVSPKGAVGLMQLMPPTARQYGVLDDQPGRRDRQGRLLPARTVADKLTDPQTNIQTGARHLAYLLKLFGGQRELAVAAYNAGEGAVQRAGHQVPRFRETQDYVKTVLGLYAVFKPVQAAAGAAHRTAQPASRMTGRAGGRVRVELSGADPSRQARPAATIPAGSATGADAARAPGPAPMPALDADVRVSHFVIGH